MARPSPDGVHIDNPCTCTRVSHVDRHKLQLISCSESGVKLRTHAEEPVAAPVEKACGFVAGAFHSRHLSNIDMCKRRLVPFGRAQRVLILATVPGFSESLYGLPSSVLNARKSLITALRILGGLRERHFPLWTIGEDVVDLQTRVFHTASLPFERTSSHMPHTRLLGRPGHLQRYPLIPNILCVFVASGGVTLHRESGAALCNCHEISHQRAGASVVREIIHLPFALLPKPVYF